MTITQLQNTISYRLALGADEKQVKSLRDELRKKITDCNSCEHSCFTDKVCYILREKLTINN